MAPRGFALRGHACADLPGRGRHLRSGELADAAQEELEARPRASSLGLRRRAMQFPRRRTLAEVRADRGDWRAPGRHGPPRPEGAERRLGGLAAPRPGGCCSPRGGRGRAASSTCAATGLAADRPQPDWLPWRSARGAGAHRLERADEAQAAAAEELEAARAWGAPPGARTVAARPRRARARRGRAGRARGGGRGARGLAGPAGAGPGAGRARARRCGGAEADRRTRPAAPRARARDRVRGRTALRARPAPSCTRAVRVLAATALWGVESLTRASAVWPTGRRRADEPRRGAGASSRRTRSRST